MGGDARRDGFEAEGALPIRHRWYRTIGSELINQEATFDQKLVIGSGRQSTIGALRREVEQTGYFDWRTWSNKESISPGLWEVRIVSDDGERVLCTSRATLKPCEPRIRVKK